MIHKVQVALLGSSFSFESMLAQGLVVNELMGENRAGTVEGVCLVEVGMCRSKGASCEQRVAQLPEHHCIMCILWLCGVCLSLKSRPNPGLLVLGSMASGCIASRSFKLSVFKKDSWGLTNAQH